MSSHPRPAAVASTLRPNYVIPDFSGYGWRPELTFLPNGWAVTVATITPELAAGMLQFNREDNRNKRDKLSVRYADDIRTGRWKLTHQGIAFDAKGNLCDGQHRLGACIEAEKPFRTLVWFGAGGNEEMAVHDTGASRSASDASQYVLGERLTGRDISLIRAFLRGPARNPVAYTHSHVLAKAEEYWAVILFARETWSGRVASPVRAAVCRAYYHADRDDLIRFAKLTDESIDPSEPRDSATKLLRRYLAGATSRGIDRQCESYRKAQRALSAYLNRDLLDKLYAVEDDLFPLPNPIQIADRNALEEHLQKSRQ